jgi:hypothetical protein
MEFFGCQSIRLDVFESSETALYSLGSACMVWAVKTIGLLVGLTVTETGAHSSS